MSSSGATPAGQAGAWARNLGAPVRTFLQQEVGGAAVLLAATVVALIWANVSAASYEDAWSTSLSLHVGSHGIEQTLREWVNNGLMALFFSVVGLEARREFDMDELRRHTHAPRIAEDVYDADHSGVSGTPTVFVNGLRHHGAFDLDTLEAAVRSARARRILVR